VELLVKKKWGAGGGNGIKRRVAYGEKKVRTRPRSRFSCDDSQPESFLLLLCARDAKNQEGGAKKLYRRKRGLREQQTQVGKERERERFSGDFFENRIDESGLV